MRVRVHWPERSDLELGDGGIGDPDALWAVSDGSTLFATSTPDRSGLGCKGRGRR